jgi:hypothetical protein
MLPLVPRLPVQSFMHSSALKSYTLYPIPYTLYPIPSWYIGIYPIPYTLYPIPSWYIGIYPIPYTQLVYRYIPHTLYPAAHTSSPVEPERHAVHNLFSPLESLLLSCALTLFYCNIVSNQPPHVHKDAHVN